MASKKSINFDYDAPVTNTFVLSAIIIFVVSIFVKKIDIESTWFICPTCKTGELPFVLSRIFDYFKLFLYVLGGTDKLILFTNLLLLMLLSPQMEDLYGSVTIGVMYFISAVFTGVLNVCFCKNVISGADSIIFMLIVLDVMACFKKRTISCSALVVVAVFICVQVFKKNPNGMIGIIVTVAGGLCGSLFAFLALPKARAKKSAAASATPVKKSKSKPTTYSSDDDATVVGTLKF